MREKIDAKQARIATLQAEILEDEKAYTLQIEKEANEAKEAVKQTLSNNVAKFKALGMSNEDIIAIINAMNA
jgi:DNA-binding transcriptional regulator YhcF (GntR family)